MVFLNSSGQSLESLVKVSFKLSLEGVLLCNLVGKILAFSGVSCLLVFSLFLQIASSLLLILQFLRKLFLSELKRSLGPPSEGSSIRAPLPIEHDFPEEASFVVLLVDNIIPFIIASRNLFLIHPDNKVAHDSVSLLLHLGHQMLLFTLILLNLDLEILDLALMVHLSLVQLFDIVNIQLLPFFTDHLLPKREARVG